MQLTKFSTANSTAKLVRCVELHWTNEPLLDGGSIPSDDQELEVTECVIAMCSNIKCMHKTYELKKFQNEH